NPFNVAACRWAPPQHQHSPYSRAVHGPPRRREPAGPRERGRAFTPAGGTPGAPGAMPFAPAPPRGYSARGAGPASAAPRGPAVVPKLRPAHELVRLVSLFWFSGGRVLAVAFRRYGRRSAGDAHRGRRHAARDHGDGRRAACPGDAEEAVRQPSAGA